MNRRHEPQQNSSSHSAWIFSLSLKIIGILLLVAAAILVKDILLLGFIALLFATLMSFPVNFLSRKLPRGVAVALTLIALLGGVSILSAVTIPKITEQFQSVLQRIPKAINQAESWVSKVKVSHSVSQLPQGEQVAEKIAQRIGSLVETGLRGILPAAKGLSESFAGIVFVFILSLFLVSQPRSYRKGIQNLVPRNQEPVFDETYDRLSQGLRNWLGGILVSMTLMGTLTGIGLVIAGIDNWFLLATFTFIGTFVPYLGAIVSAIPGLLIGLSQSPQHFLYACLVYLGVHIVEGYIVEPLIMKQAIDLRPALLLFGQALLGTLFGVLGIVIAAPLLACIQIAVQYLYIERHLGKRPPSESTQKPHHRSLAA